MKGEERLGALRRLAALRKQPPAFATAPRRKQVLQEHKGEVLGLAFSPDRRMLASVGADGRLQVVDPAEGDVILEGDAHGGGAFGVAFSPDGKAIATGGADGAVRCGTWRRKKEGTPAGVPRQGGRRGLLARWQDAGRGQL